MSDDPDMRARGLSTDRSHVCRRRRCCRRSARVIQANGGILVERFQKPIIYGGAESLRFRIVLDR